MGRFIKASEVKLSPRSTGKIGQLMRGGRWYESEMLMYIRDLDIQGHYLDVGANTGNHSIFFAFNCKSDLVLAVEASSPSRSILSEQINLNNLDQKICVIPFAAHKGREKIEYNELYGRAGWRSNFAHAVRLDDVVPSGISLVKMDIEGGEPNALRGMTRIMQEDRPRLFVEAHSDEVYKEVMDIITPFGYLPTGKVFNPSPTYEFAVAP